MQTVIYGRNQDIAEIPNLVEMQTRSYHDFLQPDTVPQQRVVHGLEALLKEVFPIYSYDKSLCLEYISYELGRPRYSPDECRKLRMTYGYPFKIRVRLVKPEPVEEEIYLGEIPVMIGGGEFIINGSERVTVCQMHRSPGVDFSVELVLNLAHDPLQVLLAHGDGDVPLGRGLRHEQRRRVLRAPRAIGRPDLSGLEPTVPSYVRCCGP